MPSTCPSSPRVGWVKNPKFEIRNPKSPSVRSHQLGCRNDMPLHRALEGRLVGGRRKIEHRVESIELEEVAVDSRRRQRSELRPHPEEEAMSHALATVRRDGRRPTASAMGNGSS